MTSARPDIAGTSRRSFILGALLGAGGLAGHLGASVLDFASVDPPSLPSVIPEQVGPWRIVEPRGLIVPTEAPKSDAYDQELHRIYAADGEPAVMLVIAYCSRPQQGLLQLHDPTVCYPGSGFSIADIADVDLPIGPSALVPARGFSATRPGRTEQVLYWWRVADRISRPGERQHLAIVDALARGTLPDGILVRVSAIGSGEPLKGQLARFAAQLVAEMPEPGRRLLLGPSLAASWSRRASRSAL